MAPKLLVLDTETTGLSDPIRVVELAYLEVDEQLNVLSEYSALIKPDRAIEPGAIGVHGITDADVADAITLEEALAPLAGQSVIVMGHNIQFDLRLVAHHLEVVGELCTLALARQFITDSVNCKLSTLQAHCNLPNLEAHRALGDAFTSLNLLRWMLARYRLDLKTHIKRQELPRMLHVMPYGKHKGTPILQVPRSYRQWLLRAGNLDKDLRYTLKKLENL